MKYILLVCTFTLLFTGCFGTDVTSLSKSECTKQGFKYKVEKRFNYRNGEYEIKSICFNNA